MYSYFLLVVELYIRYKTRLHILVTGHKVSFVTEKDYGPRSVILDSEAREPI